MSRPLVTWRHRSLRGRIMLMLMLGIIGWFLEKIGITSPPANHNPVIHTTRLAGGGYAITVTPVCDKIMVTPVRHSDEINPNRVRGCGEG